MESDWIVDQLDKIAYGYLKQNCPENTCYGTLAVYRIMFTVSLFHLSLSAMTYGATTSRGIQGGIQNGFWGPKFLFLVFGCIACFFIPNAFFEVWGKYIAIVGAVLFMLFQMFLLVDFAHSITETLLERWENTDNSVWGAVLATLTFGALGAALVMTILGYVYFGTPACRLNQTFLSLNLVASVLLCLASLSDVVREHNPSSGLAQAAVVVVYSTYLVCSAMSSEPTPAPGSTTPSCNPLSASGAAQTTTVVLGALLTFAVVSYSTTSSAMRGTVFGGGADDGYGAVETGVEDDGDEDDRYPTDDEKQGSVYSYSFYHFVFAIAAMYVAMLVTNVSLQWVAPGHPYGFAQQPLLVWMDIFATSSDMSKEGRIAVNCWFLMSTLQDTLYDAGTRALLEVETRIRKADSKEGAVLLFIPFLRKWNHPTVVTSTLLKIAGTTMSVSVSFAVVSILLQDLFHLSSNPVKFSLIHVIDTTKHLVPYNLQSGDFVPRISRVLESNDIVARAAAIRILGLLCTRIMDRPDLHHAVRLALSSQNICEVESAIFAADRLCGRSKTFRGNVMETVVGMIDAALHTLTQIATRSQYLKPSISGFFLRTLLSTPVAEEASVIALLQSMIVLQHPQMGQTHEAFVDSLLSQANSPSPAVQVLAFRLLRSTIRASMQQPNLDKVIVTIKDFAFTELEVLGELILLLTEMRERRPDLSDLPHILSEYIVTATRALSALPTPVSRNSSAVAFSSMIRLAALLPSSQAIIAPTLLWAASARDLPLTPECRAKFAKGVRDVAIGGALPKEMVSAVIASIGFVHSDKRGRASTVPLLQSLLRHYQTRTLSDPSRLTILHTLRSTNAIETLTNWDVYTVSCLAASVGAFEFAGNMFGKLAKVRFCLAEGAVVHDPQTRWDDSKLVRGIAAVERVGIQLSKLFLIARVEFLQTLRAILKLLRAKMIQQLHSPAEALLKLSKVRYALLARRFGRIDKQTEEHIL
ncbi:hypothetical protein HDU93_002202 [Gonapodya sp. JEL0774]|nr:hypothetical protein HDU93_002202 [Gonapodya sp. JEL0774]